MRCPLFVLPTILLLLLLLLGAQLGTSPGVALEKGVSHWVCVLDDDDVKSELKHALPREIPCMDLGGLSAIVPHLMIRFPKTNLVLSLQSAAEVNLILGVRRHRWLCRESC